jgi:lipopolysaccharide export system permease protein
MKIIDLYIIRKFLGTFFFMVAILMSIAVIFDVSEKIDDFLKNEAPIKAILLDYYVNFVLYYGNLFSALLIFISVIFFTSKMASNTEIVAVLCNGVSFRRMMLPYFISASLLAGMSLYFNHYVIPEANKVRLDFENRYIRNPYRFLERNIHRQINPGEFIYFESYNNTQNIGYRFSAEKWEGNIMKEKLMSQSVVWDSTLKKWRVNDYTLRKFNGEKETLSKGRTMDTIFNFLPSDFEMRITNIEAMNYNELHAFIEKEKMKGSDNIEFYEIEKHQRSSWPFATYVLTLIGVSISSRKVRGGIGLHIANGLLICVTYILCMKVTTVYSTNAGLDPLIAVWLPNIIFGLLSVVFYIKAPK